MEQLFANVADDAPPSTPPVNRKMKQKLDQSVVLTESKAYGFEYTRPQSQQPKQHKEQLVRRKNKGKQIVRDTDDKIFDDRIDDENRLSLKRALFEKDQQEIQDERGHLQLGYPFVDRIPQDAKISPLYNDFEDSQMNPKKPVNDALHVQALLESRSRQPQPQPIPAPSVVKPYEPVPPLRQKRPVNPDIFIKKTNPILSFLQTLYSKWVGVLVGIVIGIFLTLSIMILLK